MATTRSTSTRQRAFTRIHEVAATVARPAVHTNEITGKPYEGINAKVLTAALLEHLYDDASWLTAKQARKAGLVMPDAERGVTITAERPDGTVALYNVFNVAQTQRPIAEGVKVKATVKRKRAATVTQRARAASLATVLRSMWRRQERGSVPLAKRAELEAKHPDITFTPALRAAMRIAAPLWVKRETALDELRRNANDPDAQAKARKAHEAVIDAETAIPEALGAGRGDTIRPAYVGLGKVYEKVRLAAKRGRTDAKAAIRLALDGAPPRSWAVGDGTTTYTSSPQAEAQPQAA